MILATSLSFGCIFIESGKIIQIGIENCYICSATIRATHEFLSAIINFYKLMLTMDKFLSMLEAPRPQQQNDFDAEKVRFMNSKVSTWHFYGIPQATYLSYSVEEKSKMFKKYYLKLLEKYYGSTGKKNYFLFNLVCLVSLLACFLIFGLIIFWYYF